MKRPFVIALSASHVGENQKTIRHTESDWRFHYDIPEMSALQIIEGVSLLPPQLLMADSKEHAKQLGKAVLESEYPEENGWRNHRVTIANAEDDFVLFENAQQHPIYSLLRLFIVSGVVVMRFGSALMNRFTVVGTCAGNSDGEAFARYREHYLDRIFPPEFRAGFVTKVRPVPPETVSFWRRDSLKHVLRVTAS